MTSEDRALGRQGYHGVDRVRPDVEWAEPPELPQSPEIDWSWIAALLAERPGRWLRVSHPVPGRRWSDGAARGIPHLAPFRPRGMHEGTVTDGALYLRRVPGR